MTVESRQERQKLIGAITQKLVAYELSSINLAKKSDPELRELWASVKDRKDAVRQIRTATPQSAPAAITAPAGLASSLEQIKKDRENLADLREQARRALVHLELVRDHGLEDSIINKGLIDQYLPGEALTIDNVYSAWKRNALIGTNWRNPFAQYEENIRKDIQRDQKEREVFSTACRLLTERGINVSDSDANFQICFDNLLEFGSFSIGPLMQAIAESRIPGLHGFNQQQVGEIDSNARQQLWDAVNESLRFRDNRGNWNYRNDLEANQIKNLVLTQLTFSEVKQRVTLCRRIAETISRDSETQNKEFGRLLLNTARPVSELEATVAKIDQAREFRKLPVDRLRNVVRAGAAANLPPQAVPNKLPPEFTRRRILQATKEDLQLWIRKYGLEAVNTALDDRK